MGSEPDPLAVRLAELDPAAIQTILDELRRRFGATEEAFVDTCVRCGLCADSCHYYLTSQDPKDLPAHKLNLVLSVFKRHFTFGGRTIPGWLGAKALAHQAVLERVSADGTLVPMGFGVIYRSESRVQEMLAKHYDEFAEALRRLENKREWGVKVYCDREALSERIGEISDRVRELRAAIGEEAGGKAYFKKKKLTEAIAEESERFGNECAQGSHDRLSRHADDTAINALQDREITGRQEEMLLNGAYLVAQNELDAFRNELAVLEREYGRLGFSFDLTGPWPPYNFAAIGAQKGS